MKVKICGLTRREDAAYAAECGADYLGVVFEPQTPRCVSLEQAASILSGLDPLKVAVFGTLHDLEDWSLFDAVQFRSDPDGVEAKLPVRLQIIREYTSSPCLQGEVASERSEDDGGGLGLNLGGRPPSPSLHSGTPPCKQGGEFWESPELIHVDAVVPGHAGGTGVLADWGAAAKIEGRVMLAGGLTPENVAEAIRVVRPYAVDTSSGVEKETKGVKDHALIDAFIRTAKLSSV